MAWTRRLTAHPAVADALAAGSISPSYGRRICEWAEELPAGVRAAAAEILVQAAIGGAGIADLAALFEEIRTRTARPDPDDDTGERAFARRELFLDCYYRGNGSLRADLTPPAAAALQAVLDALGTRRGPEDERSKAQRDHDALEEACRLLIASGCLPARAGQPTQITLHMTLSQLLGQPEADPALAAQIAAHGAVAPPGADCDAQITPVITGTLDPGLLNDLAGRYLAGLTPGGSADAIAATEAGNTGSQPRPITATSDDTGPRALRAAAALTITDALRLLSGPAGLAASLRSHLRGPAATISLPLDIGAASDTIPGHLRRAITRRDQHCRFPGCDAPAVSCHVHHLRHRSDGGETSLANCLLLCTFHHLIAIHRWGWHLTLNPDGTTSATSPDGQRTYHSHAPPTTA
jgi:hypothetical protein